jgi:hypothetical protein
MPLSPTRSLVGIAFLNLRARGYGHVQAIRMAAKACEPVMGLAIAFHNLDHWPTQTEYAEIYEISERSAQREWAAFREAFPEEASPERFAREFYAEYGRRLSKDAVFADPAPAALQPA